jgi:hypothetical protein
MNAQTLDAKEMDSSSKINLRDESWWMSINDAYKLGVPIIAKLSKKRVHLPNCKKIIISHYV